EVIEKGTASILSELAKTSLSAEGQKDMDREALFSVMRGDINSFEIETLISDVDYRLYRFNFEASSKINMTACKNLFEEGKKQNLDFTDPYALSNLAKESPSVMQTLPAFYNIQISSKYNHTYPYSLSSVNKNPSPKDFMDLADFKNLLAQIKEFSEDSTISLSAFGEPLLNPDFLSFAREVISQNSPENKIDLLIESDGLLLTEEIASNLSEFASSKNAEVNWIIYLDSVEKSSYARLHSCPEEDFEKVLASINILEKYFPDHVYPQFTRMKSNESQLESFYRFWSDKESPSKGQLIIQKYNSVCSLLPDLKSADLSPVNRLPCWHLRRDMTILADGSVPLCFQLSFSENAGNLLTDGIQKVWSKIGSCLSSHIKNLSPNCGICDESYTFNF
ncbi:MAG: spiro-SPASM protein, partial [Treponema sp.]|nr:spiro-SPASM protein [Treponema sp.]